MLNNLNSIIAEESRKIDRNLDYSTRPGYNNPDHFDLEESLEEFLYRQDELLLKASTHEN